MLANAMLPPQDDAHAMSQLRTRPPDAFVQIQLASAFAEQFKTHLNRARAVSDRRLACRVSDVDWAKIFVDGWAVSLIDLSVRGAQVVSRKIIQPGRLLHVVLEGNQQTVLCHAGIVWSAFDILESTQVPCFRAGLEFKDASHPLLERLCSGRMLPE